ncbi:MAG: hypothetical protein ACFE9S_13195 [Candidatus Hermodarchaeota archaeon]
MILLTGFGSYGKYKINLSSEVVKDFPHVYLGFKIQKEILPVSWSQCLTNYKKLITKIHGKPKLVVLLGIHSGNNIHLEKIGWNFNLGDDIEKKFKFGPIKIFSSIWISTIINVKRLYSQLGDCTGISISFFPGLYLCNYLYYWALYLAKKEYPIIFIHIPDKGIKSEIIEKLKKVLHKIIELHLNV